MTASAKEERRATHDANDTRITTRERRGRGNGDTLPFLIVLRIVSPHVRANGRVKRNCASIPLKHWA
jgi:hypothetical protein